MSRRRGGPCGRLAASVAALLLLAGCTASSGATDPGPTPAAEAGPRPAAPVEDEVETYVALGDSFTAAPFVPVTDLAEGCFRSDGNYPRLLAEALDADLVDVSCAGATTSDVLRRQRMPVGGTTLPPQLRAVSAATDLVTVGVGGNDEDLFSALVQRCTGAGGCAAGLTEAVGEVPDVLRRTDARVREVLAEVRSAAPEARVVLVGYPRLVDVRLRCPALPLSAPDRRVAASLEAGLAATLSRAARASGVEYLDLHAASVGHEICSDDPWVNGARTDQARALAYHPFAAEQEAVASLLGELVSTPRGD